MISFLKNIFIKSEKTDFEITQPILNCIKQVMLYRFDNDVIMQSNFMMQDMSREDIDIFFHKIPLHQIKETPEYHFVHIVFIYCKYKKIVERTTGSCVKMDVKDNSYRAIMNALDRDLPKREGHIPIKELAPNTLAYYIKYRMTIDPCGQIPSIVIDNKVNELISFFDMYIN